jgi:hypothetical protein
MSGNQHLLRRAAAVRTSAAKVAGSIIATDNPAPDWAGHPDPGIAAADDHDVESFCAHRPLPSSTARDSQTIICWR